MPTDGDSNEKKVLIEVENLHTHFFTEDGVVQAVNGVDFAIREGEVMGLVGESGSGKSVTSLSIMQLLGGSGKIVAGAVRLKGRDLTKLTEEEMVKIRGNEMSMIFQQPTSCLNPVFQIGAQVAEVMEIHQGLGRDEAWQQAVEMFRKVGIPDPERRAKNFPHEISGGQAQRVMIAMALATVPDLLIADEPTTALDVTIQAQILDLMRRLRTETGTAILLITHDMGVIAEMADNVAVMYAGQVVEYTDVNTLFEEQLHPYTEGLLAAIPVLGEVRESLAVIPGSVPNLISPPPGCKFHPRCPYVREMCAQEGPPLVEVMPGHSVRCFMRLPETKAEWGEVQKADWHFFGDEVMVVAQTAGEGAVMAGIMTPQKDLLVVDALKKYFPVRSGLLQKVTAWVQAVDGVSFRVREGETFGLVGESGCGKTTIGRTILRLTPQTGGTVFFDGEDVFSKRGAELKALRRNMQIVFQDPYSSLDPRMPVGEIIGEGLLIHGIGNAKERAEVVTEMLATVGLNPYHARRYPHEFSGGQRQRIGIARALALRPKFIVCDEPVSALDVSIQSQVLNLLNKLQRDYGLTYLFIAHNLSVVEHISDRIGVMYLGKMVEIAQREVLYRNPLHPYTQALLSAIPTPNPKVKRERIVLTGDVPSPLRPPSGCRFHPRCPIAVDICGQQEPAFEQKSADHWVACHLVAASGVTAASDAN